jgi:hypothetical protein
VISELNCQIVSNHSQIKTSTKPLKALAFFAVLSITFLKTFLLLKSISHSLSTFSLAFSSILDKNVLLSSKAQGTSLSGAGFCHNSIHSTV